MSQLPIVVFSHLRWSSVFQRPQQLLTRFLAHHPIYFIEEPMYDPHRRRWWDYSAPLPNLTVCQPHTPSDAAGFAREQMGEMMQLTSELVDHAPVAHCAAWLYTPLALPLARLLTPIALAYDCMDDLAAFDGASPDLPALERAVFAEADVVFTGGPSLYEAPFAQGPLFARPVSGEAGERPFEGLRRPRPLPAPARLRLGHLLPSSDWTRVSSGTPSRPSSTSPSELDEHFERSKTLPGWFALLLSRLGPQGLALSPWDQPMCSVSELDASLFIRDGCTSCMMRQQLARVEALQPGAVNVFATRALCSMSASAYRTLPTMPVPAAFFRAFAALWRFDQSHFRCSRPRDPAVDQRAVARCCG